MAVSPHQHHVMFMWSSLDYIKELIQKKLRSSITVKAHCSVTHIKQRNLWSLLVLCWAVDATEVKLNPQPNRGQERERGREREREREI